MKIILYISKEEQKDDKRTKREQEDTLSFVTDEFQSCAQ